MSSFNIIGPGAENSGTEPVDLGQLRERLANGQGPEYWRSLEEVAGTQEFQAFLQDEFPNRAPDWLDPANRRTFLKVMGASLGLAGLTACTKLPKETIVPYVRQPEEFVPGRPLFYATAMTMNGVGTGLLVESHLGRPTKIEGNPDHPGSLGAADYFHQASVLTLYDPDRSQSVLNRGRISSWIEFQYALNQERMKANANKGAGLRILTETVVSPTLGDQINQLLKALPNAKWHQWDPVGPHSAFTGAQMAFGRPVNTVYKFDAADIIVSLGSDFLASGPRMLRYAQDFANRRRVMTNVSTFSATYKPGERPKEDVQEGFQPGPSAPFRDQAASHSEQDNSPTQVWRTPQVQPQGVPLDQITQNRLYVAEHAPSPTGSMADHRFLMKASEIEGFAFALAAALGVAGVTAPGNTNAAIPAVAADLKAHSGRSIIIAGDGQPPTVHALAHAMNQALGNVGKTVVYTEPVEVNAVDQWASLKELIGEMNAGQVQTLLVLGGNPVYTAPVDFDFRSAYQKVPFRARLGLYYDETSELSHWHVHEAHYLEAWSDTRAYDGTVALVQPLIAPLYGGATAHEVLATLLSSVDQSPHEILQQYWLSKAQTDDFDTFWQKALHDGVVPNTAAPVVNVPAAKAPMAPTLQSTQGMEIVFRPDPTIWDGAWSNNSWLQECPKPPSKLTWDNAVWIAPATAQRMGIQTGDDLQVQYQGRAVTGAAWILPGHAQDSITLHFGYGRTVGGRVCENIGINAYLLRTSAAPGGSPGVSIRKTGSTHYFAAVQHTQTMEERAPVRFATLDEFKRDPEFVYANEEERPIQPWNTLYADYHYEGYKWGMSIDLNVCTGCTSCEIACQAENNIAVVGKAEVAKGRYMHWIRIDRYFRGSLDEPELYYQPLPCMHCENAPCELVCPVAATVHSGEGINQMVYNRCVGTRYCSNNCPYKVRRFNFLLYSDWGTQSLFPLRNPDVTVRSRGVMEKCSYCIQRINAAKIESEKENRRVRDGEIVPACAQACPTQAIVFGDINDPKSKIAQLKAQVRNYSLLEELNTRPRTTYLARLRNPNPEISKA